MATYTINTALPAGETHDTYGTKYVVKLAELPETFEMWFKKEPAQGDKIDGSVENGRFKKEKKSWGGTGTSSTNTFKKPFVPQTDKSDGMRQGMCMNNAAAYVQVNATTPLTAVEWAEAVYKYATALYSKGDLKAVTGTVDASDEEKQEALDIFPG